MGCFVKKVCNVFVGLVLLQDEVLVVSIFEVVVYVVDVLVMLKICIGLSLEWCNVLWIVCIVEVVGVQMFVIYGCMCVCVFGGCVEYEMIVEVKVCLCILVIVNGDVEIVEEVQCVLQVIGVDGIMVGCVVQGWFWLFCEIFCYFESGRWILLFDYVEMCVVFFEYLEGFYDFYGEQQGVCVVCKYIGWIVCGLVVGEEFCASVVCIDDVCVQYFVVNDYFVRFVV